MVINYTLISTKPSPQALSSVHIIYEDVVAVFQELSNGNRVFREFLNSTGPEAGDFTLMEENTLMFSKQSWVNLDVIRKSKP
jgi:hypothetical protein